MTEIRLDHLNIVVADMAASVRFYRELFGLSVALDDALSGEWFEAVTGIPGAVAHCVILKGQSDGFRIELLRFIRPLRLAGEPAPTVGDQPSTLGLRHFAVRVADLDACLARALALGATGVTPVMPPVVVNVPRALLPAGKRMCYLRDPDGVLVELAEYGRGVACS